MNKISIPFDNSSSNLKFFYKILPTKTKIEEKKFNAFIEGVDIVEHFPISGHIGEIEFVSPIFDWTGFDYTEMYMPVSNPDSNYCMTTRLRIYVTIPSKK